MRPVIIWSVAIWMGLVAAALAVHQAGLAAPGPRSAAHRAVDPDLARCRSGGEPAAHDETCKAAWRKARARFFGRPAA